MADILVTIQMENTGQPCMERITVGSIQVGRPPQDEYSHLVNRKRHFPVVNCTAHFRLPLSSLSIHCPLYHPLLFLPYEPPAPIRSDVI